MTTSGLRIGLGWDRHRLVSGRPLRLGGVEIPSELGLEGHSDGDALLHAAIDALLGAAGLDDIGTLFPDDDPAYEGADSSELTRQALARVREAGFQILSLDAVIAAQAPRLAPHRTAMRNSMAALLQVSADRVNLKAKSGEKVGVIGRGEVLEATVVALLSKSEPDVS